MIYQIALNQKFNAEFAQIGHSIFAEEGNISDWEGTIFQKGVFLCVLGVLELVKSKNPRFLFTLSVAHEQLSYSSSAATLGELQWKEGEWVFQGPFIEEVFPGEGIWQFNQTESGIANSFVPLDSLSDEEIILLNWANSKIIAKRQLTTQSDNLILDTQFYWNNRQLKTFSGHQTFRQSFFLPDNGLAELRSSEWVEL